MEVSCCVMTIVDSPMCLPWKASLTSSLVLFFTTCYEAQSSRIMRLGVHFVVVAGKREYVRVLPEVLPVLIGTVLQKGWAHDEYVVKIPFEILFQRTCVPIYIYIYIFI